MKAWELRQGDCIELMRALPENSIDAIVTDPPYGLSPDGKARTWDDIEDGKARGGFMGKGWDAAVPGVTWARECYRVLKPGGAIVAFGGQRTIHRLTVSLEDAGFSIRELFGWLNWQGFPKSLDASKAIDAHHGADREVVGENPNYRTTKSEIACPQGDTPALVTAPATEDARTWEGFGTALKPCLEPAVIARKPLIGTVAENLIEWGTGALNIDGCRYGYGDDQAWPGSAGERRHGAAQRCLRHLGRRHGAGAGRRPRPRSLACERLRNAEGIEERARGGLRGLSAGRTGAEDGNRARRGQRGAATRAKRDDADGRHQEPSPDRQAREADALALCSCGVPAWIVDPRSVRRLGHDRDRSTPRGLPLPRHGARARVRRDRPS